MDAHIIIIIYSAFGTVSSNNVKDTILFTTASALTILDFLKHKTSKVNYPLPLTLTMHAVTQGKGL